MSDKELNWKFSEELVVEPEAIIKARQQALELGIDAISPAIGAQIALIAAASGARTMVEVGTGVGVSGLWLMRGAPDATLTSIDSDLDYQQHAKANFAEGNAPANRVRLITGKALDVLPRMNENSYDIVFIDADPASVIEYVEHGLRLARVGGTVLVARALWRGRVSDPAQRDEVAAGFRSLLRETADSPAVIASLSIVGDGRLQLTKIQA